MKKHIFCMLILALVLVSLFAIGASADEGAPFSGDISISFMPTAGVMPKDKSSFFDISNPGIVIDNALFTLQDDDTIVSQLEFGKTYTCYLSLKNGSSVFYYCYNDKMLTDVKVIGYDCELGYLSGSLKGTEGNTLECSLEQGQPTEVSFLLVKFSFFVSASEDPGEQEDPESPAIPENDRFKEVNISITEDLAMTFYYTPEENRPYTDYRTQATLQLAGGETVFAELRPWETEDGKKAFTFTGIAPQCMCDELTQILQGKKEDGTWEDIAQMSCSVRDYCIRLLEENKSNEPLRKLIYDLLAYGSAAQSYRNYNTEKLADEGCHGDNFRTRFFAPNDKMGTLFVSKENGERFYGATLVLNNVNYICFVLDLDTSQHSDYSVEIEYGSYKNTIPFSELEKDSDGYYRCYSPAISLCANDNEHGNVRASLYSKGVPVDSVDYWVNCYVASKCNSSNEKLRALVMRLYCFGQSARTYIS